MPRSTRFERYAGILPGFDQRPIESGEQQTAAPAALKVLFDFSEVIEVVFHEPLSGNEACARERFRRVRARMTRNWRTQRRGWISPLHCVPR